MSDHAIMLIVSVVGFTIQIIGLVWAERTLGNMLRESQRLTRAVAAMVYQEEAKTRAAMLGRE